jgi:hypothetical protein
VSVPCLASNPWHRARDSEIVDMRYINLFTPLPLPCSALKRDLKIFWSTLFWSSEEFTLLKFGMGLVAKFCFGVYSGEAKGSVLAPCITLVCCWSIHVLLRDIYIYIYLFLHCCTTKQVLSSCVDFVSKKFHNCVIFYFAV